MDRGQRWASRHDPSIVVTVRRRTVTGLWAIFAESDRVEEMISAERLNAEYRPITASTTASQTVEP